MARGKNSKQEEEIKTVSEVDETKVEDIKADAIETKENAEIEDEVVKDDTESVKEAFEKASMALDKEVIESLTDDIKQENEELIKPILEIKKEMENIGNSEELNKEIAKNPEKAEEIVEEAIKKTEETKQKIEKIINQKPKKPVDNSRVTNWWNGIGIDIY